MLRNRTPWTLAARHRSGGLIGTRALARAYQRQPARCRAAPAPAVPTPGSGPVIVVETTKGHVRVRDVSGRSAEDRGARRGAGEARLLRRPALPSRVPGVHRAVGRPADRAT